LLKYTEKTRLLRQNCKKIILKKLEKKSSTIAQIYELVKVQLDSFCDDSIKCVCGKKGSKQPEWKHQIRWALSDLKEEKMIFLHKKSGRYESIKYLESKGV